MKILITSLYAIAYAIAYAIMNNMENLRFDKEVLLSTGYFITRNSVETLALRARGVLAAISHFVFLMLYLPCWRRQTTRQLTNHGFQTYCTMHEPLKLN